MSAARSHAERTAAAVEQLIRDWPSGPVIWGGDWNHAMAGPEVAGSVAGRKLVLAALDRLGLVVPTAELGSTGGWAAIDHIAVPAGTRIADAHRIDHGGLSDHDAYVVDIVG